MVLNLSAMKEYDHKLSTIFFYMSPVNLLAVYRLFKAIQIFISVPFIFLKNWWCPLFWL